MHLNLSSCCVTTVCCVCHIFHWSVTCLRHGTGQSLFEVSQKCNCVSSNLYCNQWKPGLAWTAAASQLSLRKNMTHHGRQWQGSAQACKNVPTALLCASTFLPPVIGMLCNNFLAAASCFHVTWVHRNQQCCDNNHRCENWHTTS